VSADPRSDPGVWSAEVRLLVHPREGYRRAAEAVGPSRGRWPARPLLLLLALGSLVSMLTAGRLALPLVAEACLAWSFVPVLHVLAAAAIARVPWGRRPGFARTVDLYFMGFGPWLLWVLALTGAAFFWPSADPAWSIGQAWLLGSAAVAFAWSAWINLGFFRGALAWSGPRAALGVVAVRVAVWGFVAAYLHLSDQLMPRLLSVLGS